LRNELATDKHQLGSESARLRQPREPESHLRLVPGTEERLGRRVLRNLQPGCKCATAGCELEAGSKRRQRIESFGEPRCRLPAPERETLNRAIQILEGSCKHPVLRSMKSDQERPGGTREHLCLACGELHPLGLLGQRTPRKFARGSNADERVVEIDRRTARAHPGARVVRSIVRQDVERHELESEVFEEPFRLDPVRASDHEIYVGVRTGFTSVEPIGKRRSFEENGPNSRVGEGRRYVSREGVECQADADPAKTVWIWIRERRRLAILAESYERAEPRSDEAV
jgi:hypothetical protein